MNPILKLHEKDNVGTCLRKLEAQETILFNEFSITVKECIPQYHKIALKHIPIHNPVYKYGQIIGLATEEIFEGDYVHVHNIESMRGRGDKKEEC